MAGSPADAISKAIERSKQLLFPFKADKWFALGFTVFLAQCGEGGGGGGSFQLPSLPGGGSGTGTGTGPPSSGVGPDIQHMIDEAVTALRDDLGMWIGIGAGIVAFGVALWLVVAWFSSRAKLMLVESVIWDRVDLGPQWSRAAELGFSLFKLRVALGLAGWFLTVAGLATAVMVGLPDFQSGQFLGSLALVAYSIFFGTLLLIGLPLGIALALTDDFVVPLMVVRNAPVRQAWAMCRAEVLAGNVGGIIVFYLLRFVLALGIAIAVSLITCLTCCLTAVPYLGTVILLPIWIFSRAYPLYYLEQLGIQVFPMPEPAWAAYDQWRFPR